MNFKRAVGLSVLAYFASFVIGIAVAVVAGIDVAETQAIPPLMWYAGAIAAIVFAVVFTRWYFRSPTVVPSAKAGFLFGLTMVVTGFVLDVVMLLPLLAHDDPWTPILAYYFNPFFLLTLVFVISATTYVGKHLGSRQQRTSLPANQEIT